jgi:dipeptidase
VAANQFVMRGVDPNSKDFMYSANLWTVAIRNNLWAEGDGFLDFKHVYGRTRGHPPYATRRVWRVYNLAAPSLNVSADTDEWGDSLPFSVPVDNSLAPEDLMRFQRDHYEGTAYNLTVGLAAGPYGDPTRFDPAAQPADNLTVVQINEGGFERAISMFRTSYSIVTVPRDTVPDVLSLVWFTQYAPHSSSYVPLYVSAKKLPTQYTQYVVITVYVLCFFSAAMMTNTPGSMTSFDYNPIQRL